MPKRGLLEQLDSDLEVLLSRNDYNLQPDYDSQQQLSEVWAQVEAAHPRLTVLMRQMVDSFAYLGVSLWRKRCTLNLLEDNQFLP